MIRALYLEPYQAGSHAAFTKALTQGVEADWTVLTLPGRHWKWRARGSAVYFAHQLGDAGPFDLLFASAYLPLQDLLALKPALAKTPSVLYFHENQLAFPVQAQHARERDFHFGFSQMISALAATHCAFNSRWNMQSFLDEARTLLKRMPDAVPPGWIDAIEARSTVLHLPLSLHQPSPGCLRDADEDRSKGPIILWNHRWEYDKAPEAFFEALKALDARQIPFRVVVCGQRFKRAPAIFEQSRQWLGDRIVHWGYAQSQRDYLDLLERSHIAVSTAIHEFFGISMVEAAHHGTQVLVPDRLSYPEIFPKEHLYRDQDDLIARLEAMCKAWIDGETVLRADRRHISAPYGPDQLQKYRDYLCQVAASAG